MSATRELYSEGADLTSAHREVVERVLEATGDDLRGARGYKL